MTVLPLLAVGILMKFAAVLFVLVCLILILVVLMQKGRGGGLSGAFGGGMASGLLGSKTGDFLTWVTIVLVAVFLLLAVLMARYYRPSTTYGHTEPSASQQPLTGEQTTTPQPGAAEQPAPTGAPATTPSGETPPAAPAGQPATPPAGASAPATPDAATTPSADTGKTGG